MASTFIGALGALSPKEVFPQSSVLLLRMTAVLLRVEIFSILPKQERNKSVTWPLQLTLAFVSVCVCVCSECLLHYL